MNSRGPGARTSVDILNERDSLRARVDELESAVAAIERESEYALRYPEINFLAICRIATLTRRARPGLARCTMDLPLRELDQVGS